MQDVMEMPQSRTRANATPAVLVVLAATLVGSSLGLLVASREDSSDRIHPITQQTSAKLSAPAIGETSQAVVSKQKAVSQSQMPLSSNIIAPELSSIVGIHYSEWPDYRHLEFSLKNSALVHIDKIGNPNRIYLDLQTGNLGKRDRIALNKMQTFGINDDLIAGVRIAQRESGILRIVLDLKRNCDYRYEVPTRGSSCLVVDVRSRMNSSATS